METKKTPSTLILPDTLQETNNKIYNFSLYN